MRSVVLARFAAGLVLLCGPAAAQGPLLCSTFASGGERMTVELERPLPGSFEVFPGPCCDVAADALGRVTVGSPLFDFYFVIDSSGSSANCTGEDIDGDGLLGTPLPPPARCTDPDDSVLGVEVKAVRDFVATLDPARARVAIIQFSDPRGAGALQRIVVSLTDDLVAVMAGLDSVLAGGGLGATDYGGALTLLNLEYSTSADPTRHQRAYYLSDGVPTFPESPFDRENPRDSQSAIDALELLASTGIILNSFGVGFIPSPTRDPVLPERCLDATLSRVSTLECLALRTGGSFLASTDPTAILDSLTFDIPILGIASASIFNDTAGTETPVSMAPDGAFSAVLPLKRDERNFLRLVVSADDGTRCEIATDFEPICLPVLPCCGDGIVEAPEECDDGNDTDGDGCDSDCTVHELAVSYGTYAAELTPAGVRVTWNTLSELDTLGFEVWARAASGASDRLGPRVSARGGGSHYEVLDTNAAARAGGRTAYRIVELTARGAGDATPWFDVTRPAERPSGGARHRRGGSE